MAEYKPISKQGLLTSELIKIYSPTVNQKASISNIKFSPNDLTVDYNLFVYKYVNGQESAGLLYSLELNAGDWVNDDTEYELNAGESIQAYASVDGLIAYEIDGQEIATNSNNYGNFPSTNKKTIR